MPRLSSIRNLVVDVIAQQPIPERMPSMVELPTITSLISLRALIRGIKVACYEIQI